MNLEVLLARCRNVSQHSHLPRSSAVFDFFSIAAGSSTARDIDPLFRVVENRRRTLMTYH